MLWCKQLPYLIKCPDSLSRLNLCNEQEREKRGQETSLYLCVISSNTGTNVGGRYIVIRRVTMRYHDLPKRTGTDRNGPERTETDFRGYRNGLSEYRNGLSGNRNGPERTETDFRGYRNGLSEYRNGLSGNRNGPERTETDFCEYRNGLCGYRIVIWSGFLFLWVLGMGYVILLWHSMSLPYNYFGVFK